MESQTAQQRREQLQAIVDSSPHGIFIKDLQGHYLQTNLAFEQMVRRTKDQIVGRTGEEILPPGAARSYQESDLQCLVAQHGIDTELTFEGEDGRRTYKLHKFPLRDDTGKYYAIFGFLTDITAAKRAEAEVQVNEEKFRQLAENISEVFWITDAEKREMVYVSPAYETIWGRSCASLTAAPRSWLDAIHPEDRDRVTAAALTQQIGAKYDETYRIIRPDGSVRWVHDRAFPLRDAAGAVYRIVGVAEDISEMKRIQDELARREEQYRGVFNAVTEGLVVRRWDGPIVEMNRAYCQLLGCAREELLGSMPEAVIAPDSLPLFRLYVEAVRHGSAFRFQGRFKRKDGALVPVEVSGSSLTFQGGPHLLSAVTDVSARKDAEEARRRSEAEARITFENAPLGMALLSAEGRPVRCNRAVQQLLGYSEPELQGMIFSDFVHPDEVGTALERYWELRDGKRERYQIEIRCRTKSLGVVNVRLTTSLVPSPGGEGPFAIVMLEDITEQKRLEEQFLRAQRMESVGTLAGGIAHDLNNILAPMLMAAGLLKGKLSEPRDHAIVDMIEQGARRGAAIIRQLLTFSRGLGHERKEVQVRHLINEMVQIIQETFPRNIRLESFVPKDLWPVQADPTQLHQVLLNLCINSRDAMPRGGRLTLKADNVELTRQEAAREPGARAGRYVRLTVADTGGGIPPEILGRIFDPFFTTKGVGQGTGLGLSTVLGIVKNHDGFLTVASEPGQGAEFKVYLPVADAPARETADAAATPSSGRGELILVVDDEAPVREATRHLLEANQYRVVIAGQGEEALQRFIENREAVRLVLTDVMMPVMDGVALVRSLRVLEPGIRVVAMSGLSDLPAQEELRAMGVSEIVAKPCDSGQLLQAVRRALESA
jgi:hypothetical protein